MKEERKITSLFMEYIKSHFVLMC